MSTQTGLAVLLLEDDLTTSRALRSLLMSAGYEPVMAYSVRDAMKLIAGQPYAILDLLLPDGSGMEVLQEIREKYPDTRVLISSGCCDATTESELQQMGVALQRKPMDFSKIQAWLHENE